AWPCLWLRTSSTARLTAATSIAAVVMMVLAGCGMTVGCADDAAAALEAALSWGGAVAWGTAATAGLGATALPEAGAAAGCAAGLGLAFSEPSSSDLVEDFAFFAGLASALACLVSAAGFDLASAVDLDFVVGFLSFSLLAVDSLLPVAWATVECA